VRGRPSGGCGASSAERKFPSDKVYRRDDRGIVGVESLSLKGLAFFDIHTVLDAAQSHGSQGTCSSFARASESTVWIGRRSLAC
jgi:hypothetical protein